MVMNGIYLVIASACILILAYRFYGAFIAAKVLTLDQYRPTPAMVHNDGHDYVPTNKWVTFGHHFAAIAGAGPLVGPVIAAQFGYLPGALWILIGSVLAGAVHDMVILFASVRYDGKSIADIAREEISKLAGFGAMLATLFLLIITLAGMAVVVANALHNSPWGFFSVFATIPIAIFIGIYLKWLRPGKIQEATIIGVALIFAAIIYGPNVAASEYASWFTYDLQTIEIMLAVYGFFAAALPVWLLLAPRDYLSTYLKIGTIGALALGIIIVMPEIQMPAVTPYIWGGGPVLKGSVFPYIFITIACGALSGFHTVIATGTTPKMLTNEKEILPIGRVGRYLLQELLGHFHPKFNDQHWAPGVYGCAALICILWGYLVLQGNIGIIWPLFGVSNQLLGTMTLAVGTTVIMRLGRKRYAWVTGIPCILMAIVAIAADFENVFNSYIPAGKWILVVFSAAMFLMILIVLIEAVRSWIRLSNIPQDYRTQAEIEAESLVKYGKEVKA